VFIRNLANNGKDGKVMCDQIKGIDKDRLLGRAVNRLGDKELKKVNQILTRLLKLKLIIKANF
jgi:mRNA-degrading endonuclease toxin of MazEF toxin-antitoxin module